MKRGRWALVCGFNLGLLAMNAVDGAWLRSALNLLGVAVCGVAWFMDARNLARRDGK